MPEGGEEIGGGGFAFEGFHAGEGFVVLGEPLLGFAAIGVEEGGVG
jgi:hypothetical protein